MKAIHPTPRSAILAATLARSALAILLIGAATLLPACRFDNGVKGSGTKASDPRTVDPFTRIRLGSSADVRVTIGTPQSVVVEADDNLLPLITTEVKDERLHIGASQGYSTRLGVTVTITAPRIEETVIAGSGDANLTGVTGDHFRAEIDGSGDISASGTVKAVEARINGSGDLNLIGLPCQTAEAAINGSGDIAINVSTTLKARINGSGNIEYMGNPQLDSKIAGSGNVKGR